MNQKCLCFALVDFGAFHLVSVGSIMNQKWSICQQCNDALNFKVQWYVGAPCPVLVTVFLKNFNEVESEQRKSKEW